MISEDKIRDEKLKYVINTKAAKISALSSGKIDKYEYRIGEKILLPHQSRMLKQVRFTFSPFRKALENKQKH